MPTGFRGEELVGANALTPNMSQEEIMRRATTNYTDEELFTLYTTLNDSINPTTGEAEVHGFETYTGFNGGITQPSGK